MCLCLKNINISVSYPNTILLQHADFPYVWALFVFLYFFLAVMSLILKIPRERGGKSRRKRKRNNFRNLREKWPRDSTLDSARPRY